MKTFLNDKEILTALRNGDVTAFEHVYGLFYKPICYFAEKIIGSVAMAEDIATECFVKLLQKKPEFESMVFLKSFLYTTAKNGCFDQLRMNKRHEHSHMEIKYISPQSEDDIENKIIQTEVMNAIYASIANLPGRYKKVVHMALVEGMNNEEIARETGMAYQTIRNHKSEGIKLLRLAIFKNSALSKTALIFCMIKLGEHL